MKKKSDLVTWDTSLKVGDIVFSNYTKNELLFQIVSIERRFLEDFDFRGVTNSHHPYYGHQKGDEYNPLVTIKAVANLSVNFDASKKLRRMTKVLDGSYLTRVDPSYFQAYVKRLQGIIGELWPSRTNTCGLPTRISIR